MLTLMMLLLLMWNIVQDPILTAFELSWELRRLAFSEHEFKSEYLVGTDVDEGVEDYCWIMQLLGQICSNWNGDLTNMLLLEWQISWNRIEIKNIMRLKLKVWQIVSNWNNLLHQALRKQCQNFGTALLDHTRSSGELGEIFSNFFHICPNFFRHSLQWKFHTHLYPENCMIFREEHWNLSHCEQKQLADICFPQKFCSTTTQQDQLSRQAAFMS